MDAITAVIFGLNFGWLTSIAAFFDNELVMVAFIVGLVLLGERRKDKLLKIALGIIWAILLVTAIKEIVHIDRPCVILPGKIDCPSGYSFPSGHTLLAFTVMLAFLNKPNFFIYFAYAVFIAFTRVYLGVHSFEDVAGSVGLAPFAYYLAEISWSRLKGEHYAFRNKHGQ